MWAFYSQILRSSMLLDFPSRHHSCLIAYLGSHFCAPLIVLRIPQGCIVYAWVVLAMVPNSRVGSGSGSTRNRTVAMGRTTRKTRPIANWPVLPPKTRHFNITSFSPIKYLSSDCIVTWSVRRLCSSSHSFTSRSQICDSTNIRWIAVENPLIWLNFCPFFTATQRISVRLQFWKREVKERLELHNLHTDHVTIRSELQYLIAT